MHVRPLLWSGIGFSSMSEALRTSSAPQIGPKAPTRLHLQEGQRSLAPFLVWGVRHASPARVSSVPMHP
jgi:hypothetical protein